MKIKNKRLNESILNFNSCTKRRNEVAEYYFEHGIQEAMNHFNITKQAIYCDVRAYNRFMDAYNLITSANDPISFLNINARDIMHLFNNPKVSKFFDRDCKLKDIDFTDLIKIRHMINGAKSFLQLKDFIRKHYDLIRG